MAWPIRGASVASATKKVKTAHGADTIR